MMMSKRLVATAGALCAVAVLSFAAGTVAQPRFPEVDRAEGHLQAAQNDLHIARDVFGGHKVAAERLIAQAIGELQAGRRSPPNTDADAGPARQYGVPSLCA
jgi:hypothetical protein